MAREIKYPAIRTYWTIKNGQFDYGYTDPDQISSSMRGRLTIYTDYQKWRSDVVSDTGDFDEDTYTAP